MYYFAFEQFCSKNSKQELDRYDYFERGDWYHAEKFSYS